MKTLWNIVCVLALANLLALGGLVVWMKATDRLDVGRMRQVRQLFSRTITEVQQQEEQDRAAAETRRQEDEVKARIGSAPVTAADRLNVKNEESEIDRLRRARAEKEIEDLRRSLLLERADLEKQRAEFEAQRKAWEEERAKVLATDGEQQFQKALATMEALKPAAAKAALRQLIDANQFDQVVAYLNGMQDRTRTRIIEEFVKDDPKMAADLLERVRTRGVEPRGPTSSPG
jgi:hypothetical protein